MSLYINKSLDVLMNSSIAKLENTSLPGGKRLSVTPGSTTRLLLAIINSQFEEYYKKLEEVHLQSFLSTSSGEYIDMIGELVGCIRNNGESDINYKTRVSKQVTVLEKANMLSVKMSLLAVDDVQDVKLVPYTHGSGSFTAFIVTDTAEPSSGIIEKCKEVLEGVVAYGIRYNVEGPELIPVELGIKLILKNEEQAQGDIIEQVRTRVREFINSRDIGAELIFNEIVETVMATADTIYDMEVFEYKINGVRVLNSNQRCRNNERFIECSKPGSIQIV